MKDEEDARALHTPYFLLLTSYYKIQLVFMTYLEKLQAIQQKNNSWLCVGLDPDPERLPLEHVTRYDEPVLPFNKKIIDATADLVCAYKPNLGFYLQWGAAGIIALERTIAYIPNHIPVILDCKTGDLGKVRHTKYLVILPQIGQFSPDSMSCLPAKTRVDFIKNQ